jgi:cytochrome b561
MQQKPTSRYTPFAVLLHWLMALAITASFILGSYMTDLPFSPSRLKLYNYHKWAGITILAFAAIRLLWRLTHKPPADLPMPSWQKTAAHAAHALLYALFFAIPLVGWAYSSAAGFPVVLFGVLPLPDFVSADKALAELIKPWHERLAWALVAVLAVHIAGSLKHQFIDRDGLLSRMWFSKKAS